MEADIKGHKKIRFKNDYSATIIMFYDKDKDMDEQDEFDEFFHAGKEIEVDIWDDQGEYVNVQFIDGEWLFGLKKEDFEIVKDA
jgi:hypothetical protein